MCFPKNSKKGPRVPALDHPVASRTTQAIPPRARSEAP